MAQASKTPSTSAIRRRKVTPDLFDSTDAPMDNAPTDIQVDPAPAANASPPPVDLPSASSAEPIPTTIAEPDDAEAPSTPQERLLFLRRTYLLSDETILLLGDYQAQEHRRTRKKPDLSQIVDDAIYAYVTARMSDTAR